MVVSFMLVHVCIDVLKEDEDLREENDALKAANLTLRAEKKLRQAAESDLIKISDGKCCYMLCLADGLSTGYVVELICMQVMMSLQGGVLPSKVTRHNIWNGRATVLGCTFPRVCSFLMNPKAK